jgi:type IV pilus assembly protein PilA
MNKLILWILAGLMAACVCAATAPATGESGDEEDIRVLYSRIAAALRAQDVDAIMRNYAPGNGLVVFDPTGGDPRLGFEACRKYYQDLTAGLLGPPIHRVEIRDLNITVEGNFAYSHAIEVLTSTSRDGSEAEISMRVTGVLRKIQGKWLISQEHFSFLRKDAMANQVRPRDAANEAAAVAALRTLNTACVTYSAAYGTGFPAKLSYLGNLEPKAVGQEGPTAAGLIVNELALGTKDGYIFLYNPGVAMGRVAVTYMIQANPISPGETGGRYFYTDQSGVIRSNPSRPATKTDPPIR